MGYTDYLNRFEEVASRYIPKRGDWTPSDEAVYGPPDPYRVPTEESDRLR